MLLTHEQIVRSRYRLHYLTVQVVDNVYQSSSVRRALDGYHPYHDCTCCCRRQTGIAMLDSTRFTKGFGKRAGGCCPPAFSIANILDRSCRSIRPALVQLHASRRSPFGLYRLVAHSTCFDGLFFFMQCAVVLEPSCHACFTGLRVPPRYALMAQAIPRECVS